MLFHRRCPTGNLLVTWCLGDLPPPPSGCSLLPTSSPLTNASGTPQASSCIAQLKLASTSTCGEKSNAQPGTAGSCGCQEYHLANPHASRGKARVWFSVIKHRVPFLKVSPPVRCQEGKEQPEKDVFLHCCWTQIKGTFGQASYSHSSVPSLWMVASHFLQYLNQEAELSLSFNSS